MKKILMVSLLLFTLMQIQVNAQNGPTTVHLYDITGQDAVKSYGESIKKINQIIKEIGYPGNYYSFLRITDADKSENYKYCTIGHWTSDAAYTAIHENPKFKAWAEENKKNAVYVKDQLYRKLYTVK